MSTQFTQKPLLKAIWQQPDWPNFKLQGLGVQDALLRARKKQGEVIGQANAIGLQGAQDLIQSRYVQEIIATSAIEVTGVISHCSAKTSHVTCRKPSGFLL